MITRGNSLTDLYTGLAEALALPLPDWLTAPGTDWPLFAAATCIAAHNPTPRWREAIIALAEVPAAGLTVRQQEYHALFAGHGRPPIWLYESQYVNGRILGPASFAVKSLYAKAGLEVTGTELPDHASLELAFLAFLAAREVEQENPRNQWRAARRLFIKLHAKRWLPNVGQSLIASTYPAWVAIGRLLVAVLSERLTAAKRRTLPGLPQIIAGGTCSLCGFCVQVCPTRAFQIHEDAQSTTLYLLPELCIRCRKCERVCEAKVLAMTGAPTGQTRLPLTHSPRVICPGCGTPTVSQAEINAVAARLGQRPAWLSYCLNCRDAAQFASTRQSQFFGH